MVITKNLSKECFVFLFWTLITIMSKIRTVIALHLRLIPSPLEATALTYTTPIVLAMSSQPRVLPSTLQGSATSAPHLHHLFNVDASRAPSVAQ